MPGCILSIPVAHNRFSVDCALVADTLPQRSTRNKLQLTTQHCLYTQSRPEQTSEGGPTHHEKKKPTGGLTKKPVRKFPHSRKNCVLLT